MAQEMTSFVLRFVREVSEEQGARWRGLIQHVQSGAERNFASFADAVQFMQGRVVENTVEALEKGEQVTKGNPFTELAAEMTKLWGDLGPQMVEMWGQATERAIGQSMAVRSQVDQAVAAALKAWELSPQEDQETALSRLTELRQQVDQLAARVNELEHKLAAQQSPPQGQRSASKDQ
jgi:hypothetical protein